METSKSIDEKTNVDHIVEEVGLVSMIEVILFSQNVFGTENWKKRYQKPNKVEETKLNKSAVPASKLVEKAWKINLAVYNAHLLTHFIFFWKFDSIDSQE